MLVKLEETLWIIHPDFTRDLGNINVRVIFTSFNRRITEKMYSL